MDEVRVSVIIPCYNREALLCETLVSMCAQTYGDWEAVVVDDNSEDNSLEVAQSYGRKEHRIHGVKRQGDRGGASICRNQGLSLARGEYVIFLDSDDLLSPTCLEHRVAAMDGAPDYGFGVYQTELFSQAIGDRGVLWNVDKDADDLHRFLSLDVAWTVTGPIWRRKVVSQLGGFDEDALSFQDWALHIRALIRKIKYFKKPLRDHFYRHGHDRNNQISSVSYSHPDHLASQEDLFTRTAHDLQIAGLLDGDIRCRVAALFWRLATIWQSLANAKAAERVWRRAAKLGLCNRRHCLEGLLILKLYSIHRGGRIARLIQRFWPPQYTGIATAQVRNVPVGLTETDQVSSPHL